MNYKKLFGFGVLIWAVAYLVATVFVAYKMGNSPIAGVGAAVGAAIAAYFSARSVKAGKASAMFSYSFSWLVIAFVLDLLLTVPFTGWAIFSSWALWISYALILLVPLFTAQKSKV